MARMNCCCGQRSIFILWLPFAMGSQKTSTRPALTVAKQEVPSSRFLNVILFNCGGHGIAHFFQRNRPSSRRDRPDFSCKLLKILQLNSR
jgi:hypothetical protein